MSSAVTDIDELRAQQILEIAEEGLASGKKEWARVHAAIYEYAVKKGMLEPHNADGGFIHNMNDEEMAGAAKLRQVIAERIAVGETFGEPFDDKALPEQFTKTIEALERQDAQRAGR